jgi:EAL domain-containing protein (putative c-di-GMP-specific phosphodiesterase class I)/DNA-binding NarL/FixJ family response regulator
MGGLMGKGATVLVADDNVLVQDLVRAILRRTDDFRVVAAVQDAAAAVQAAAEHRPALALVDVRMPGGGPAAARGIREVSPGTRVIALSSHDDAVTVRLMLAAGAVSYVIKGTPSEELLEVMRAALVPPQTDAPRKPDGPPQRVLVAVSDPVVLDELADAVMSGPGLQLVGLASTAYHALSLATRLRPDIAVVDAGMTTGGASVSAALAEASPGTRIAVWGYDRESDPLAALLEAVGRVGEQPPPPEPAAGLPPTRRRFERLASVLADGRVDMQLQAIVTLADERAHGYEALARFPGHPDPGPDVWFAEAHRADVGVEMERLAVRSALAELDRLPSDAFLAVNVSPDTAVSPGLRDDILAGDAARVVLELTEHAPVHDYAALSAALAELRGFGTKVAVDDCGAGFTSLRHVALIAPDYLKLDMVLCRDVREPARAALARALVSFAQETGSVVIAEGIEQRDDLEALRELGVEMGQGYLLSRPVAADSLQTA